MLVISRKQGEAIKVAENIEVTVISVDGHRVRLGIKAPRSVRVLRSELDTSVAASNQSAVLQPQTGLLKQIAKARQEKSSSSGESANP
ncbi:MAG: carbon storage regulator CsrA [Verrucomicrobiota bacterium]